MHANKNLAKVKKKEDLAKVKKKEAALKVINDLVTIVDALVQKDDKYIENNMKAELTKFVQKATQKEIASSAATISKILNASLASPKLKASPNLKIQRQKDHLSKYLQALKTLGHAISSN